MEMVLAITVLVAIIFFGALISAGNERQRKAIDGLREQAALWAMQDLRIKRKQLAHDIHVDDPLSWFNKIATKACGHDLSLQFVEAFENPQLIKCIAGEEGGKVVFTLLSPAEIRTMKRAKRNRLSELVDRSPLLSLPRGVHAFQCSVLNHGILFDLELPLAWKGLTGKCIDEIDHMWIYMFS